MSEFPDWSGKAVGLEASSIQITAVALDPHGVTVDSRSVGIASSSDVFEALSQTMTSIKAASPALSRVGLAVPGLVDRAAGRIAHTTIRSIRNQSDIASALRSASGLDVVVENDANAAAIAEHKGGAGRGAANMFYITVGEGIGGAIIINGELWRGDSGFAGEFGSIALNSEGMRLEDIASAGSIVRRTQNRFHQDSTSSLSRLREDQITIEAIVGAAVKEDDFAMMMLERTGTYIGTAVATVINLLDIERIVIGGAIMNAGPFVLEAIVDRARELAFRPAFARTKIVAGELGGDAAAIGAALLATSRQ
jgi:glucokinase